jgi:hypothetical protein
MYLQLFYFIFMHVHFRQLMAEQIASASLLQSGRSVPTVWGMCCSRELTVALTFL